MQLIAGRTAQEYNHRKNRRGAYWEDRYHATAVGSDRHLWACMQYIDLNMVRAGVVSHPAEWLESGYCAIQWPAKRYQTVDLSKLMSLSGCADLITLQRTLARNVEVAIASGLVTTRESMWSESLAVGEEAFVESVRKQLGHRAGGRAICRLDHGQVHHYLREEPPAPYVAGRDLLHNPLHNYPFDEA